MKIWRAILLSAFAIGSSGCVIKSHWLAKEASGIVRDADTGDPLADVTIYREIGSTLSPVSKTDFRGQFHVGAKRSVRFELPFGDPAHMSNLVFRKAGFVACRLSVATITGDVYQSKPPLIAEVTVSMQKEPNKALEPTTTSVTSPAAQETRQP